MTITFIAKLKLALVIGAPEIVGKQAIGQGRSFGSTVAPTHGLDQAMAIQHGVNGRGSRSLDGMRQAPQEALPDLTCPPVRFLPPGAHDGRLQLRGEMVGGASSE